MIVQNKTFVSFVKITLLKISLPPPKKKKREKKRERERAKREAEKKGGR